MLSALKAAAYLLGALIVIALLSFIVALPEFLYPNPSNSAWHDLRPTIIDSEMHEGLRRDQQGNPDDRWDYRRPASQSIIVAVPTLIDAVVLYFVWNQCVAPICPLIIGHCSYGSAVIAAVAWLYYQTRSKLVSK